MKCLLVAAALGCGPSKPPSSGTAGTGAPGTGTACDAARAKVEQLYRAEAKAREPNRVDEAVADNTAMVMTDCGRDPGKVSACLASVETVKELEQRCLAPIDDEGSEGDRLAH